MKNTVECKYKYLHGLKKWFKKNNMTDPDVKWMFMHINYLYSDVLTKKKKSKFLYSFK